MTTDDLGAAADQVYDRLQYQVALFARRAERVRMGGVGEQRNSMDRAAYLLLNRLEQEGPVGVKALAQAMGIDSSTVTRQVAPLVDCGLVDRVANPNDGRAVLLELSAQGRQRLQEVRLSRQELMRVLVSDWPEEERTRFCALLTQFNRALHDYNPQPGLDD
ncbi:MarR family winged helix-turn-helix transcriptional regulator [Streptacidiphilus albus]|uniref:MarR family winged helix-turn-helix transcriptional regulator n=1 Tax=Streptacidiphilus albus TaxID=105425 RepID=UPI00054C5D33|nr:MarR family transcriptional regulator [Streptacidiphilus albus]